jgi:hypothetical protein
VDPDRAWLYSPAGWQETAPFATTTQNTMSYDVGDLDNDGSPELFATDMKPYRTDATTLAAWQPVMDKVMELPNGDPQVIQNVLQMRTVGGAYVDRAVELGLDATGWSWSSKFGDLDNDGFLDIYVVNGMAALDLFSHLPNNELVEEHQALRNLGGLRFEGAPEWGLNGKEGGRGMSMADLDLDGDLEIVVNNLMAPATLYENRLCGGRGLEVDLYTSHVQNNRAVGAELFLHTSSGVYYRDVRAASGYLSGDPVRVHFGLPANAHLEALEVRWPDGAVSVVDDLSPGVLLRITRTDG